MQSSKDAVSNDAGKKTNEEPAHEGERNGQEKEGGASNKENDQHVQDFRVELHNLLVQQKEGYANNTNRVSTVNLSVITAGQGFDNDDDQERINSSTQDVNTAGPSINTASENINTGSSNINTASPIPNDLSMQYLEATSIFDDAYDDKEEVEEVYVCQPPSFEDPQFPDKVYKVVKALYGLHQAPRAWYETLSTYLLKNRYRRGNIDKTLFIKKDRGDNLLVQVYVDDIIFGSTKKSLCVEFEQIMHKRFQMSSMGELTFFLGLHLQQKEDGIFISQDKYVAVETVYKEWEDKMERAATLASSLRSKQNNGSGPRYTSLKFQLSCLLSRKQFWQTAFASTLENGNMEIIATIDGKVK
ncbi:putative ribonuclease H-like domain-containing protein [Tanacetum coccineum]